MYGISSLVSRLHLQSTHTHTQIKLGHIVASVSVIQHWATLDQRSKIISCNQITVSVINRIPEVFLEEILTKDQTPCLRFKTLMISEHYGGDLCFQTTRAQPVFYSRVDFHAVCTNAPTCCCCSFTLRYRLFEGSSVEEILEKLQKDQSEFAQKQVEVRFYGQTLNTHQHTPVEHIIQLLQYCTSLFKTYEY